MSFLFGEIQEPFSRAIDSDEDFDAETSSTEGTINFTINYQAFSIIKNHSVELVFIINSHKNINDNNVIGQLIAKGDNDKMVFAKIYKISDEVVCLIIDGQNFFLRNYPKEMFVTNIFIKHLPFLKNDVQFVPIVKRTDEIDIIEYLYNNKGEMKLKPNILGIGRCMVAPTMISDPIISLIVEMAIIQNISCVILKIPFFGYHFLFEEYYPCGQWKDFLSSNDYFKASNYIYT